VRLLAKINNFLILPVAAASEMTGAFQKPRPLDRTGRPTAHRAAFSNIRPHFDKR